MTPKDAFTYEQVVEIIRQLSEEDRRRLKEENFFSQKSDFPEIDGIIDPFHDKYREVYKALA
jgi:hypothetical protein